MNTSKHIPLSALSAFFLGLLLVASSCSKKDVVQDEPLISPSEESESSSFGEESSVEGESMGDSASMGAGELRSVYFAFDRYALGREARDTLSSNADWLKQNPSATIQIEGHCDERGTIEYNLALGERRANAVRNYLSQLGIDETRLSTISYGEERPANPGHDDAAWAENRRTEFVILSQ